MLQPFLSPLVRLWWALMNLKAPDSSAASPPVPGRRAVLVHGIYDTENSMSWIRRALENRGWQVYTLNLNPGDGSVTFEVMAEQIKAFVEAGFKPGEKFDLVGFSMGGLATRYYVQKLGGAARVLHFVTISAPNHGSMLAWLAGGAGIRQMRPGSEMLRDLNNDPAILASLKYTSIYTPLDLSIFPSWSSRMPVGRNVVVWVPLHPLMVMMPSPMRALERALE